MHVSVSHLVSAFMAFSFVSANLHDSCTCHNGDSYNWRITTKACEVYDNAKYQWGGVQYDTPSGRCTQRSAEDKVAGKEWEAACKQIASEGFACTDGEGLCFADPKSVRGWC